MIARKTGLPDSDILGGARAQLRQPDKRAARLAEFVPVIGSDVGLAENAVQRADRDLGFPWHNGGIDDLTRAPHELDMAALLAGFDKAGRFKTALDLAERLGLKPPQPRPRSSGPEAAVLLAAVRSAVQSLP